MSSHTMLQMGDGTPVKTLLQSDQARSICGAIIDGIISDENVHAAETFPRDIAQVLESYVAFLPARFCLVCLRSLQICKSTHHCLR